jgi:hypothetical protein
MDEGKPMGESIPPEPNRTEPPPVGTGSTEPVPTGNRADEESGTGSRDLGEAWRRAGTALGNMGGDVGDSVRQAWDASGREPDPEHPADALRRFADVVERSVATARGAAASPEARQRVGEGAREANDAIERAVRLSLAEVGRALQRLEPKDEEPRQPR